MEPETPINPVNKPSAPIPASLPIAPEDEQPQYQPLHKLVPPTTDPMLVNPLALKEEKDEQKKAAPPEPAKKIETKAPGFFLKFFVLVLLVILLAIGIILPIKIIPSITSGLGPTLSSFFSAFKKPSSTASTSTSTAVKTATSTATTTATTTIASTTASTTSPLSASSTVATSTTSQTGTSTLIIPAGSGTSTTTSTSTNVSGESGSSTASSTSTTSATTTATTTSAVPPASTSTPASQPASANSGTVAVKPVGLPNLAVVILNTGYLNGPNGQFVPASSVPYGEPGAIQFEVINRGTGPTGTWSFIASLPSDTNPTFASAAEENLNPGGRIVFTLGFNGLTQAGPDTATITVDPGNLIRETTKADNTASVTLIADPEYYSGYYQS